MKNAFVGSLTILAKALGRQLGVEVVIGAENACTDGHRIWLPALPLEGDPRLPVLANGYIDHESAHIRFTDFGVEKPTGQAGQLFNVLEDIRIEQALMAVYPGCRAHLAALMAQLLTENPPPDWATLPDRVLVIQALLVLLRCQVLAQAALAPLACAVEAELHRRWPAPVVTSWVTLALRVRHAASTADVAELTKRLWADLDTIIAPKQPTPVPGAAGASASAGNPGLCPDREPRATPDDPTIEAVPPALGADEADGTDASVTAWLDPGQWAAQRLGDLASVCPPEERVTVAEYGARPLNRYRDEVLTEARAATVRLRARLGTLMQTETATVVTGHRHGQRLDPRQLYRLATHDGRLFTQRITRDQPATAVGLLLDRSGSMQDTLKVASLALLATALALEALPGVVCQVVAFPGRTEATVLLLKGFHERTQREAGRFQVRAEGGTPLAQALWRLGDDLSRRPEPRKLLLVATDGHPSNPEATGQVIDRCRQSGIEVLGLGIGQTLAAVGAVFGATHAVAIAAVAELAPQLFALLERQLLKR